MMSVEDLFALPQAGKAALVAHRWLLAQGGQVTAVDLLSQLLCVPDIDDAAQELLSCIAATDEGSRALLAGLSALYNLDRADALAKALGMVNLRVAVGPLQRARADAKKKGGAA